jgi:hypothetical protein
MYVLFGRVIKVRLGRLVSMLGGSVGWSCPITRKKKKKKVSHQERRARAKAKVRKFRRRALAVALVVRCRRRPSNKPQQVSTEPIRWKWKKRPKV